MDGHVPPEDLAHIRRWRAEQSAKRPANALHIECVLRQRAVDIKGRHEWLLGVSDAHGDFRRYQPKPTGTLTSLPDEVDTDPFFAFCG